MINFKLNKTTTVLPQQILKGSQKVRTKKALNMNKELFEDIKGGFAYGEISPNILIQIIKRHIPKNINVIFEKALATSKSGFSLFIPKDKIVNGYLITIPVNPKTQKVQRVTTGSIMQSMSEFFDRICNPKYNPRGINYINKITKNPEIYLPLEKIYTTKPFNEKELREYLKKCKPQEQINILQLLRYNLTIKLNAYKQGEKYQKEIEKIYRHKDMNKTEPIKYKEQHIPEKIAIIEKVLAEIIKKERTNLAK